MYPEGQYRVTAIFSCDVRVRQDPLWNTNTSCATKYVSHLH